MTEIRLKTQETQVLDQKNTWILDVLTDLSTFTRHNNLTQLNTALMETLHVAEQEIKNTTPQQTADTKQASKTPASVITFEPKQAPQR